MKMKTEQDRGSDTVTIDSAVDVLRSLGKTWKPRAIDLHCEPIDTYCESCDCRKLVHGNVLTVTITLDWKLPKRDKP